MIQNILCKSATYKVCTHTIATAEATEKLQDSVLWFVKQKCAPSYLYMGFLKVQVKCGVLKTTYFQVRTKVTVIDHLRSDRLSSDTTSNRQGM